jgi:hypothetical protein
MLKLRQLVIPEVLLVLSFPQFGRAQQPEPGAKIDPSAVKALRAIVRTIQACPEVLEGESNWGKKPLETARLYTSAPSNIVWDVVQSVTARSPFAGYIQFSVSRYFQVPPETRGKFDRTDTERIAEQEGHIGKREFRYEYDVGPDGAQLSRSLVRGGLIFNTWRDNSPTGDEFWKDGPKDFCWDKAARNPLAPTRNDPPAWGDQNEREKQVFLLGIQSEL